MKKLWSRLVIVALLFVGGTATLLAQSANTSAITGTVTDPSGAVVPNVQVTVTSVGTNQVRTIATGSDGVYRVPLLEPGVYKVRFSVSGFKSAEIGSVNLPVTETIQLDRALEVGSQTEQITVEAAVETLQTATSSLGTTVTGSQITSLPLSARNFTQVLGMAAGVASQVGGGADLGRGTGTMSVNGASPEKNNFQMDGVSVNNAAGNNAANDNGLYTGITIPNPDALQEFKIQTSTYDASFGRNPGANVNVVTKSGTNEIHGSLWEFFRNEKLNANDFFYNRDNPLSRTTKQVLKQNQFGFTLGAPIKKDKLFAFGSYQGTRQRNGVAAQGTTSATLFPIPEGNRGTTALVGGDDATAAGFRRQLQANMCAPGVPQAGRGSLCGANALPINDVAIRLLQVKLPDGTYFIPGSGTSGTVQRLISIPAKYSENQYLANVDWVASEKHSLQMKYMYSENPYDYSLGGQLPGIQHIDARSNTSALLRLTSLVTPTVVNQARISFQRIIQQGTDAQLYTPQSVGMKPLIDSSCCQGTTRGSYSLQTPMAITGAFTIGGGLNPSFAPTNQTQYADNLSFTKGAHTHRLGFEYENIRYPLTFGGLGRGQVGLNSFPDFLIGRRGCSAVETAAGCSPTNPGQTTGTALSSFTNFTFPVRSSVNGIVHNYNLKNMSAFYQDDWKVSNSFTLNVGVRWEYNGILSDKYGNLTNFWQSDLLRVPRPPTAASNTDPNAFIGYVVPSNYDSRAVSAGGNGPLPPGVRQLDSEFGSENRVPLGNFAPRIGFAWQATQRLVFRGGAGLFYDRVGINRMVHAVQEGRPYADTTALVHDSASLQNPYQDRPLALLPRWYDFTRFTGSNFNSPFYDKVHTPLVRQYNLGLQYEFIRGYVVEAAYVGSWGINLMNYNHVINPARIATASNPVNGITTTTAGNATARVPYLGFLGNGLQQNGFDGMTRYDSLQLTVRKNLSRGLQLQMAYTFSKNLSTIGHDASNLNLPTDMGQQYGQTPFSRPHRLVFSYQYQLPFGSSGNGFAGHVLGGWSVSGLTAIQSGNPLTLTDNRGGTAFGVSHARLEEGVGRANICPGFTYADVATPGSVKDRLRGFFNKAAFNCGFPAITPEGAATNTIACPTCATTYGNTGLGLIRGPGQLNFDASVSKITHITEKQTLQIRADFFNLFNHAQFNVPTAIAGAILQQTNAQFGNITSTSVNPRIIQLGLRYQF